MKKGFVIFVRSHCIYLDIKFESALGTAATAAPFFFVRSFARSPWSPARPQRHCICVRNVFSIITHFKLCLRHSTIFIVFFVCVFRARVCVCMCAMWNCWCRCIFVCLADSYHRRSNVNTSTCAWTNDVTAKDVTCTSGAHCAPSTNSTEREPIPFRVRRPRQHELCLFINVMTVFRRPSLKILETSQYKSTRTHSRKRIIKFMNWLPVCRSPIGNWALVCI